jgi:hypothetical protein
MIRTAYAKEDLERLLLSNAFRHKTVVIGGHYPLEYANNSVLESIDDGKFGAFPEYTLALAAKIVAKAKAAGADASIALLVDDTSQMKERDWYLRNPLPSYAADIAQYFVRPKIPASYTRILDGHGLSEKDVLPAKNGLLFQETKCRVAFTQQYGVPPSCAGELGLVLRELQAQGATNVIGFIPSVCEGPSCTAARYTLKETTLRLAMTYLPTGEEVTERYLDEYLREHGATVREYGPASVLDGDTHV